MFTRLSVWVRDVAQMPARIRRMEPIVSELSEQLDATNAVLGTVRNGVADIQTDVRILINAAPAEDVEAREAAGRIQETLGSLVNELAAFRSETPDADGSETPTEPTDPTDPGEPETFSRR